MLSQLFPHGPHITYLVSLTMGASVDHWEVRKLGHRPGGYGNAVEDYWPWPGRSLMRTHPYSLWLSNIKELKLAKAVAGLEK
jgi:hypothetical protein